MNTTRTTIGNIEKFGCSVVSVTSNGGRAFGWSSDTMWGLRHMRQARLNHGGACIVGWTTVLKRSC